MPRPGPTEPVKKHRVDGRQGVHPARSCTNSSLEGVGLPALGCRPVTACPKSWSKTPTPRSVTGPVVASTGESNGTHEVYSAHRVEIVSRSVSEQIILQNGTRLCLFKIR